ncbi:AI-2E family transporter [Geothermobacter hydrogeniphilus]|uniref:AI-2E family transporter n=1 Tax=Geothermobacter hydrogeniphilus TaxID=1969733 RepID=UPI001E3BF6B5|nr:AI-2E family transporter [Geothermobacter hydrogeniphilus]
MPEQLSLTRTQLLLIFLVLTASIASGLALFTSASRITELLHVATTGIVLPVLLSLVLAFLLEPLVRRFERGPFNRTASIFLVSLLTAVLLYLAGRWLSPHWLAMWGSLRTDLPRYLARGIELLNQFEVRLNEYFPFVSGLDLPGRGRVLAEHLFNEMLSHTTGSALRLGSLMLLVPLFTFFFLRDGQKIIRFSVGLAPNRYYEMAHDLSYLISRQLSHFVRGRILEAAIVGIVVGFGLSFTDIRYAPLLGLFAGVTNLVPYLGPIVGMIPGILIALVDLGMGGQFWWILATYLLIGQVILDNFILIPILISHVSNLHPLWVIIAIIMGGKLYGVLGMIIGVPVASIIKIIIIEIRYYRRTFALPLASQDSELTG